MPPAHLLPQPSEEYMQLIKKVDEDQGMLAQFCEEKVRGPLDLRGKMCRWGWR